MAVSASRDRNLASTLYTSALPVSLIWVASILLLPPSTPRWLSSAIFWSELSVMGLPLLAGAIQKHRDRVEDDRQRAALKLARRRRMLSQGQLIVVWFVGGYTALMLCLALAASITVALSDGQPSTRKTIQLGSCIGIAFLIVVGLVGWIHVSRRASQDREGG